MRFIISGDVRKKKHLYWGILFFSFFSLLFWINNFIYYYINFGFDYDSLFKYYFTDVEFPEKISLKQVSENVHINLFLNGFLILITLSIVNIFDFKKEFKFLITVLTFVSGLFYSLSDLFIYILNGYIFLKPLSFFVFQIFLGINIFFIFYGLFKKNSNPYVKNLKAIIGFFSFFMLIFFFINLFVFYQKIGFCFDCIKVYYLGDSENYIKPKTFEGVFKTFYPHLLTMAFLSFTLLHFLLFSSVNKFFSVVLGVCAFIFSFLDNFSPFLIMFVDEIFIYLKILSFFALEIVFIISFITVLYSVLKKELL